MSVFVSIQFQFYGGNVMLKITEIKIDELYPSNEPQLLEELTLGEIHEIRGGLGEIDSPDSDDIDTNNVSSLLKYIDEEANF